MNCDLTEKVSLLIDAELAPREAAQLRAHIEDCADCRQAQEAFMLLRQGLRAYQWTPDPHAQSQVLGSILASQASRGKTSTPSASAQGIGLSTPSGIVWWLKKQFAGAFAGRGLQPAHVAALALILVGSLLGIRWLAGSSHISRTTPPDVSKAAKTNTTSTHAIAEAQREGKSVEGVEPGGEPSGGHAKPQQLARAVRTRLSVGARHADVHARRDGVRTAQQRRPSLRPDSRQELARVTPPVAPFSPTSGFAYETAGNFGEVAADPTLRIGRHAEQVEMLLRSFRNARLTESDPTLDVADARRLSKRLLYTNITLRREAASRGNLPVEGLLDSLEPTLLDISNLPDKPSHAAVGSIKERIRKRQLVGVLQAQAMLASR